MTSCLALSLGRGGRATSIALALALGATPLAPLLPPLDPPARAAVISVHVRERLSRYGEWQQSTRYGEVWVPSVDTDWRPYTVGHWVWTEDGWYWQSEEPFGQIVFHYGRWVYDPDLGWVWVVGDEWAPAWVVWRESDDDIGWVPAPPRDDVVVEDVWWTFVPAVAIGAANLVQVVRPVDENQTLIQNTTIINQRVVINENNDIGSARLGRETVPINAGPPISRLPANVVSKVRAAGIVPPPRGGNFAAARLDPSKGRQVKQAAAKLKPTTPPATKPNASPSGQGAATKPNALPSAPGAAAKTGKGAAAPAPAGAPPKQPAAKATSAPKAGQQKPAQETAPPPSAKRAPQAPASKKAPATANTGKEIAKKPKPGTPPSARTQAPRTPGAAAVNRKPAKPAPTATARPAKPGPATTARPAVRSAPPKPAPARTQARPPAPPREMRQAPARPSVQAPARTQARPAAPPREMRQAPPRPSVQAPARRAPAPAAQRPKCDPHDPHCKPKG
ncbi:DUF6600 domain-containing protein [Mesorhizobium sp. SP-1A]|uniref:DUF6600 domain-containing protein n=1 Tax=Mesorhizobium sp. SP-1A TaxID=3077840 RepID=UPI0028F6C815|nr:DUF6600 domain-containing protein [Mesorhizobium sp. SP-1A]